MNAPHFINGKNEQDRDGNATTSIWRKRPGGELAIATAGSSNQRYTVPSVLGPGSFFIHGLSIVF
ncbi:hypothetical protein SAMN04487911_1446 [Arenibacter nanhaiticus]|uniref:Uncharacterized protein n=1 Tax=Arenibacter nanhaiticus TaxID=558155 RepID=A0A1M6MLU9_9FLAO|nr:hypothetical protein [Arenibacter nanhaiticus]SHJ84350.1 hypothetical protein SAMN04487911_1446 [Arenibacter nanhaiticus]